MLVGDVFDSAVNSISVSISVASCEDNKKRMTLGKRHGNYSRHFCGSFARKNVAQCIRLISLLRLSAVADRTGKRCNLQPIYRVLPPVSTEYSKGNYYFVSVFFTPCLIDSLLAVCLTVTKNMLMCINYLSCFRENRPLLFGSKFHRNLRKTNCQ